MTSEHLLPSAAPQMLYKWGPWVWYYRMLALVIYTIGVLSGWIVVMAVDMFRRDPGVGSALLIAVSVLLVATWLLWAVVTWRSGQTRVARLVLLPDGATLRVRTLNFTTRTIPLADIVDVEYRRFEQHFSRNTYSFHSYYLPHLIATIRNQPVLNLDLAGRIFDRATFQTIFRFDLEQQRITRPRKNRGRPVMR